VTTANWVTLIAALLGIAVPYGGFLARLKIVEAKASKMADELTSSRERQGGRIGVVEERCAVLEGAIFQRARSRTRGGGVAIIEDDHDGR
jgi:hypothetical protein